MSEMKPTPGEWMVETDQEGLGVMAYIKGFGYWVTGVISCAGPDSTDATKEANARLIAEAGTVFHETGLSPRQLVEMNAELVAILKGVLMMGRGSSGRIIIEGWQEEVLRAALTKASASSISKGVE